MSNSRFTEGEPKSFRTVRPPISFARTHTHTCAFKFLIWACIIYMLCRCCTIHSRTHSRHRLSQMSSAREWEWDKSIFIFSSFDPDSLGISFQNSYAENVFWTRKKNQKQNSNLSPHHRWMKLWKIHYIFCVNRINCFAHKSHLQNESISETA